MRIGFTERGDAGLDLSWYDKLSSVDGAIIITKNVNQRFRNYLLKAHQEHPNKLVLHAGCTGLGSTIVEPHVPTPQTQLENVRTLIDDGFPIDHVVLRIDPIIPIPNALSRVKSVIQMARNLHIINDDAPSARIRASIYDEYAHVKARWQALGILPIYPEKAFYASTEQMTSVTELFAKMLPNHTIETCAEPKLCEIASQLGVNIKPQGCLSYTDLQLMDIDPALAPATKNGQNRHGCLCLTCKKELLTNKKQCPHGCVYCYWQNN